MVINDQWLVTQLYRILVSRHAHDLSESTAQAEDEEFWMRVTSRREAQLERPGWNTRRGIKHGWNLVRIPAVNEGL